MKLCAVVVIYGQKYTATNSYKSLEFVVRQLPSLELDVIIYDNSPSPQNVIEKGLFHNLEYKHDPRNIGVVPAYLFAKDYCIEKGISWLLRLDQDSSFDEKLINEFETIAESNDAKAIAPIVICNNEIVSPSYIRLGGFYKSVSRGFFGFNKKDVTFINSMSFINVGDKDVVDALSNLHCQLDLSDHEFARLLPRASVYLMKTEVNHSLSIKEKGYISKERYKSLLINEIDFMNRYENGIGRIVFRFRLFIRILKFVCKKRADLALVTINAFIK